MTVAVLSKRGIELLADAKELYEAGYDIHWIEPPVAGDEKSGKRPVGEWRRSKRYSWKQLERSFQPMYNLGFKPGLNSIVCGKQIVVLDVDHGRIRSHSSIVGELQSLLGNPLPPPTVVTGGGGAHYYLAVKSTEALSSRVLWKGADTHAEIRLIASGEDTHGNVVMPPSNHWSGGIYKWEGEILSPSPELLEKLREKDTQELDLDFELGQPINIVQLPRQLARTIKDGVEEGQRSERLYWIIGQLWTCGYSREDILATLICEDFGISDKYREAGIRAVTRAKTDIARCLAKHEVSREEAKGRLEKILDEFNGKYCHVAWGDSTRVVWKENEEVKWMRENAFASLYSHLGFVNGTTRIEPARIWLVHPNTPVYHRVVFDPHENPWREGNEDTLNLWQGFAVRSPNHIHENLFHYFQQHTLENICSGDENTDKWLWNWMAHLMQKPWEKPPTAVVLRGATGTGKSEWARVLRTLIGSPHSVSLNQATRLTGRFNKLLADKILVVAEEVSWGGNVRDNAVLRDMITAGTFQIEAKGVDSITVPSYHRFIFISNEDWPVQALAHERRYALFDVGRKRQKDVKFFGAMRKQMESGGYEALMSQLLQTEIDPMMLHAPPATDLLREQQEAGLQGVRKWIHQCLVQGYFYDKGWRVGVDPERMAQRYKVEFPWDKYSGRVDIGRILKDLFWPGKKGSTPPRQLLEQGTKSGWKMPRSAGEARLLFDRALGSKGHWE